MFKRLWQAEANMEFHLIGWEKSCPRRGFRVAGCERRKWQGVIVRCRRVRCERVAGCEVAVSHLAKFGDCKVRCPGVAPCDLFLIILRDFGGNADLDANILGVSGKGRASVKKKNRTLRT